MLTPSRKHLLSATERTFLSLVSRAVLANPFGDERKAVDGQIAGRFRSADPDDLLTATIREVRRRIERMDAENRADVRMYEGEERRLVEYAFLFDIFHEYIGKLDSFIYAQNRNRGSGGKPRFAADVLEKLHRRGFLPEAAARYFAMFFQLRRAYFFIGTSLIGRSASMKRLREKLWNNIFTQNLDRYNRYLVNRMEDFSTLIIGETGTGKGTAAGAIGRSGFIPFDTAGGRFVERFTDAFIPVNLSRFSESLIESELFGHRKGAFTGAVEDHAGVFGRCSPHGAIFLDEIGEVSEAVQIKLLQVIQERWFSPVGSRTLERFHGRVIAAANRPLAELRGKGGLRADFYYRLCSDVILVPPLRERLREDPGELDDLLGIVLTRILGAPSNALAEELRAIIEKEPGPAYAWPGNVREVEQLVRRLLLDPQSAAIDGMNPATVTDALQQGMENGTLTADQLICGYCARLYRQKGTYEAVSRITNLDRRTVRKYIERYLSGTASLRV